MTELGIIPLSAMARSQEQETTAIWSACGIQAWDEADDRVPRGTGDRGPGESGERDRTGCCDVVSGEASFSVCWRLMSAVPGRRVVQSVSQVSAHV